MYSVKNIILITIKVTNWYLESMVKILNIRYIIVDIVIIYSTQFINKTVVICMALKRKDFYIDYSRAREFTFIFYNTYAEL